VVVTIGSLKAFDAGSIEDLSIAWALKWGIGQKGKDNGILLIVAKNDRKMRIEVGYGAEGAIPDLMAKRIIDEELKPSFKKEQYYQGFNNATDKIMQLLASEFTKEPESAVEVEPVWIVTFLLGILSFIGGIFYLIYWAYKKIVSGQRKKQFKQIEQWLTNDSLWNALSNTYMPNMVSRKRKELQDEFLLLSDSPKNSAAIKKMYDMLSDMRHAGYRYFKERNDSKLKQALKKLETYEKDPVYDKPSIAAVKAPLMEEVSYFKPLSTKENLGDADLARLHQANTYYGKLISKPEEILLFNTTYLQNEISQTLDGESLWGRFRSEYTADSIEKTRKKFKDKLRNALAIADDRERGIKLYHLLTDEIEALKRSPGKYLTKKYTPPPRTTTTVFTTGSSWGSDSGGSSWSSSDSGSSWSSGSDFGGGDFGGGGASGDW
jgi:uncharacterized membrane protein YgcG